MKPKDFDENKTYLYNKASLPISSREEYDEVRTNPLLRDHAIFIGYAPYDNPRYSIAVIVENGESGGRVAGPIAKEVLEELLNGF